MLRVLAFEHHSAEAQNSVGKIYCIFFSFAAATFFLKPRAKVNLYNAYAIG